MKATHSLSMVGSALASVGRRPDLWPTAAQTVRHLVPDRWWRKAPFLPLPDRSWVEFRLVTAYGGDGRSERRSGTTGDDLVTWLEWQRDFPT